MPGPGHPRCETADPQKRVGGWNHSSEKFNESPPDGKPATLGELKASGHVYRTVKQEIRENLLSRMRAGEERFPGIVGFDDTVLPHVERALLAGHDIILLGERGQGKTRLIRTLVP